jgi:hypothetical protein
VVGPGARGGAGAPRGTGGESVAAADPIDQMVREANELLPALPASKQRELTQLLAQLQEARTSKDARAIAALVPRLAMLLVKGRG